MAEPGPRNLITDVPGHPGRPGRGSRPRSPARPWCWPRRRRSRRSMCAAARRAAARPSCSVRRRWSSGSTRSCCRAARRSGSTPRPGVMDWLAAQGRGFAVGEARVPIVPAAILFDLNFPARQHWTGEPPHRRLGREAAARGRARISRSAMPAPGSAPRPAGSRAASAAPRCGSRDGATVGALVAVNCCGAAVRPDCGRFWAAELALAGEIPPQPAIPDAPLDLDDFSACGALLRRRQHDDRGRRDRRAARQERLPALRDDGAGRAGAGDPPGAHAVRRRHRVRAVDRRAATTVDPARLARLGTAAADCLARAIMRAVVAAEPLGGLSELAARLGRAAGVGR